MIRLCHWCGEKYNSEKESSIWCSKNPHRGKGKARLKHRKVKILCLLRSGISESAVITKLENVELSDTGGEHAYK